MTMTGKALAATAFALLTTTAPAFAQAPQIEKNVSMKMAQIIIDAAIEQCTKDGYKVTVVVVDKAGLVAASLRGDGTNPHTMETARLKAYTSRTRGITTVEFNKTTEKPELSMLRQLPGVTIIGGGVPIKVGTETIGGVGVSGAPGGEKNEVCALAGIAKVDDSLK